MPLFDLPNALRDVSPVWATLAFACENGAILALAVALGEAWVRALPRPADSPPPGPVSGVELGLAAASVAINTAITVAGWLLWRDGWIRIRSAGLWLAALDCGVLLLAMDLAMYGLHRVAHQRWIYAWLHARHHIYTRPRPLTLFVMHPLECLGFGLLWLALITIYSPTWLGLSAYLILNVFCGTLGHLGVEPLPARWARAAPLRWLGTSRFHLGHHQNPAVNLGFYTQLWDRLFGTLGGEDPLRGTAAEPAPRRADTAAWRGFR